MVDIENGRQPRSKLTDRLNIIIRRPNTRVSMIEVDVRCNEGAAIFQQGSYFREFLRLNLADILKHALRHNDIEPLTAKGDRSFDEIGLHKIRRLRVNGYVDPVILDVPSKHPLESRRSATNVEKIALSFACDPVYEPGDLLQPEVGLRVVKVLLGPKVSLEICLAHLSHNVALFLRRIPGTVPPRKGRLRYRVRISLTIASYCSSKSLRNRSVFSAIDRFSLGAFLSSSQNCSINLSGLNCFMS